MYSCLKHTLSVYLIRVSVYVVYTDTHIYIYTHIHRHTYIYKYTHTHGIERTSCINESNQIQINTQCILQTEMNMFWGKKYRNTILSGS